MNSCEKLYDTFPRFLQEEVDKTYNSQSPYAGLTTEERLDICAQVLSWMKIFPTFKAMNSFLDGKEGFLSDTKMYEDLQDVEPTKRQYAIHVARSYAGLRTQNEEDENEMKETLREKLYRFKMCVDHNNVVGDMNDFSMGLNVSAASFMDYSFAGLYELPPVFEDLLNAQLSDPEYEKINAFARQFSFEERIHLCEMAYEIGRTFKTPEAVTNFIISNRDDMIQVIPDIKELRQDREMFVMIAAQYYVKELNKQETLGKKVMSFFGLSDQEILPPLQEQNVLPFEPDHIQTADPIWVARNRALYAAAYTPVKEK